MQESRRHFFTDAAHQLKTPLAIIQAESELTLRESLNDAARVRVVRLHSAVQQAAKSVRQLLFLSRLDADSGHRVTLESVALDRLARSVTLDWSQVARARGIDLGFEQEAQVEVHGQPELLKEVCSNLIDNAIRYAGDGSVITVRVARDVEHPLLQVIDNGPGIPQQERDAVFERFYRSPGQQHIDGTGLGLAIVREIARAHHADVTLEDAPQGGLVVSVRF